MDILLVILLAGAAVHAFSRGVLLVHLSLGTDVRGVSLITQELYAVVYCCRYLELLAIYTGFVPTVSKIAKIALALAIVLLFRFGPSKKSYDAEFDTVPRWILLLPPFALALVYNRVAMFVEVRISRLLATPCQFLLLTTDCSVQVMLNSSCQSVRTTVATARTVSAHQMLLPTGMWYSCRHIKQDWLLHTSLAHVQIFHQFSWYLEPLALIPQFVLMYRKQVGALQIGQVLRSQELSVCRSSPNEGIHSMTSSVTPAMQAAVSNVWGQ
jgi:hypothetical protein